MAIGSCAPAAIVSEDAGAGGGRADGGELHPRRFLGQARHRLVAVVSPGDLADRAVGRIRVAHLKVDGHDGHRVVLEGELALRVVGLLPDAVVVQRLVLDSGYYRCNICHSGFLSNSSHTEVDCEAANIEECALGRDDKRERQDGCTVA